MKPTDEDIVKVCTSSRTMVEASYRLGIHFNTLKRRAIILGVYKPTPQKEIKNLSYKTYWKVNIHPIQLQN